MTLYSNDIRNKGARAIAESLKSNSTLTTISIDWNDFDDEIKVAIQKHLSVTKKQQKKI